MIVPARCPGETEAWLATPEAIDRFDPSALGPTEYDTWSSIRTARRRRDWESSRALLGAVPAAPGCRRSLTHSHGYAGVALAPATVAIGMDIEWMASREFKGMASVAFPPAECEYLATLEQPAELCSAFYCFWTLKEAFAKALDLTLADALGRCRMIDADGSHRVRVPCSGHWRATVYEPRPRLRLAVVRVCESPALIRGPLQTIEWPSPRSGDWPVVMDLAGGGGGGSGAW